VPDWIRSEADEYAVAQGCYFDEKSASRVVEFFRQLRHTIGQFSGQPFEPLDWQRDDILYPLFGWKAEDGTRRYRVAYVEIPKKNGKSTLCSGIGLYLLMGDREQGAEVYVAASDREQAGIVYRGASAMVKESPKLQNYVQCVDSKKNISLPSTNSFLRVVSSDAYRQEGLNIHGLIFDELHAQPDRRLYDALRYGGASRRQPLHVNITTAGYDRHSICFEQHKRAKGVLDGSIQDESYFAFIAACNEEDGEDWQDPVIWRKANPSLGVTMNERAFKAAAQEALESPTKENTFKRYRLNIWTEQDVRWLPMKAWDACPSGTPELAGRDCYAGLDLAATRDISALSLVFREGDGFVVQPYFWVPLEGAERRSRVDGVPYRDWIDEGLIRATEGNVIDYDAIRRDINDLYQTYHIREIAIDRWNAVQLATQLIGDGFDVKPFGQGYKDMTAPTKELEKLVVCGRLYHRANPVLRWMAGNVTVDQDPAGNLKPNKEKSSEKIDGIVATIMALGCALREESANPEIFSIG
jgi:phage terminase large subunit-like protein